MDKDVLREVARLEAMRDVIDARLKELQPLIEADPSDEHQSMLITDFGTIRVVREQKRYVRRYGDDDARALQESLPHDVFERYFVDREPRVVVDKPRVTALRESTDPDVVAVQGQVKFVLDGMDELHREEWEEKNPPVFRWVVDASPDFKAAAVAALDERSE